MSEKQVFSKKNPSPDWFVQGVLAKLGDMFDSLLGRSWKPSSSFATSELIEKLKQLLDSEARDSEDDRRFVPHQITLKMQWDKFSTDAEDSLKSLETELLTAVVDHINDKRYYTYAPIKLEVKPDYFTSGVKLFVGFENSGEDENEAGLDIADPGLASAKAIVSTLPEDEKVTVRFDANGHNVQLDLFFAEGKRLSVGRTKENDLTIDDPSVSKMHASLMLNLERQLIVADTGSTNGTFIGGQRIPYGKAVTIGKGEKLKFGSVEVEFEISKKTVEIAPVDLPKTDVYTVGDMEFTNKTISKAAQVVQAKTENIDIVTKPTEQHIGPGLSGVEKVETK